MSENQKPQVEYRIQPQRTIQITNQHSERKERARTLAVLRSCLFGRKRYQNIYLNCSLNNLFNALRIAHLLNQKVPDLAMIIRFQSFKIVEMQTGNISNVIQRKRIEIKLTYHPSGEDKLEPGYNPGKPKQQIKDPIQTLQIFRFRNKPKNNQPKNQNYTNQNKNYKHKNESNNQPNHNQGRRYRQAKQERIQQQQEDRRPITTKRRGGHQQNNQRHSQLKQLKQHDYKDSHIIN